MISPEQSRPQARGTPPAAGSARAGRTLADEHALLDELWQISHFGWVTQSTIHRGVTISAGHEIPATALAQRLRQLLERGWAEQRLSTARTGEREWRLTDSGRNSLPPHA